MSEPLQRVAALAGIPALLEELAVDIDEVLQGLGIRRDEFFPDNRIPVRTALHLLDQCAKVGHLPTRQQRPLWGQQQT